MKSLRTSDRSLPSSFLTLFPLLACILNALPSQAEPVALGAIDQVDEIDATITVLGQKFPLARSYIVSYADQASSHTFGSGELSSGELVWIDAQSSPNGQVDYTVYVLPERYTEGSTGVFLSGQVSEVSDAGTLKIGELTIDVNAAASNELVTVSPGDRVQLFGTQPVRNGLFLAESVTVERVVDSYGVGGSSALGVGGSGALGVGGSGKLGVGGSGKLGVGGSGALGVGGSGALGVGGSGKLGVGGSGTLGVGGSGTLGVGGSGTLGVGGSGTLGVGGSGTLGVGGSGTLGVGGSGTLGVGGSGAHE